MCAARKGNSRRRPHRPNKNVSNYFVRRQVVVEQTKKEKQTSNLAQMPISFVDNCREIQAVNLFSGNNFLGNR